jgi:multicomponent Na+:H+ antiporter subunit G
MPPIHEIFVSIALILGTFLMLTAGIGLVRFPDVFCRMHASGKAGTLGIVLVIVATILLFVFHPDAESRHLSVLFRGTLAIFFQFLTTPAATHILAKASYVIDYPLSDRTAVDELKEFLPSKPDEMMGGLE